MNFNKNIENCKKFGIRVFIWNKISNNKNAGSFGPITIQSGVTVTVGSGETWTVV